MSSATADKPMENVEKIYLQKQKNSQWHNKRKKQNNVYEEEKETNQGIIPKGSEFNIFFCQSNLSKNK